MKRRLPTLTLLSFFLFLSLVHVAFCDEDQINVNTIPQAVGEKLGIPEPNTALVGGLIISMVFFMAIVLPSLLLGNKSLSFVFCFLALGLVTALGWLSPWFLLMISLLICGTAARQIMKWFR